MERIAKPLRLMGAQIQTTGEKGTPPVSITGSQNLKGIQYDLPMASAQVKSGSMRLLSGMLSAQKFDSVMTGDASLSKRPMERIAKPLREMGAQIQTTGEKGTPPVSITGSQALKGIQYDLPMASAQVKSGILLAGLWAAGETSVTEPEPTRDHTERMLRAFGYDVKTEGTITEIVNKIKSLGLGTVEKLAVGTIGLKVKPTWSIVVQIDAENVK
jgi:3-phosphoshikimate 1-carboxyvinyltransferase